ncbi:MAG TPA: FAD-binding oxidoreductase [Candidatus Saccharimonadales bacterium]|nr:FAD-binding oxidoreductase [Candidatus Saccharimonadales bacterium]
MRWTKELQRELRGRKQGKVSSSARTLKKYSHDASMFELRPQLVVFPKNEHDISKVVNFVRQRKADLPFLSITARSGGTDMSGGAINDSIILDVNKYMHHLGKIDGHHISTQPGVFYRKFEKRTLAHGLLMPSYPASREICTVGGMAANNAGGEKTLRYGKTIDYIRRLKVILSDGQSYTLKPLNQAELNQKLQQRDFEGEVYHKVYKLIEKNYDQIKAAKPKVSKNSTGYNLWDVWDKETFDLSKLFVGSQGTLGLITEIEFGLVEAKPFSGMLIIYLKDLEPLGSLITTTLPTKPDSFEVFDDHSLILAIRFFFSFWKILGIAATIKLAFQFIPDLWMLRRGIPKLVALAEFEGDSEDEVRAKVVDLEQRLHQAELNVLTERAETAGKAKRYWLIRRESFNLLRHNVKDKHTAPFIDDLVVPPAKLPEFLPKLQKLLDAADIVYTIAGHVGDGNFHIIPLMDLADPRERAKIPELMKQVNHLVLGFGGSLSGEHNDGLVRGPFLEEMYGPEMMNIFREAKKIFDPDDIFNPHKKVDAKWDYSLAHIRHGF